MYKYDAIVAGHICFDVIPGFPDMNGATIADILAPGKLINMNKVQVSTGGPVSNTGIALSMLGMNTGLMGKIGNDYFGQGVLDFLEKYGARDGMVVADGVETSYTVVIVPPGYDRIFLHNPGANDSFGADDIDYNLVAQSRLFHLGYPPLMKRMYSDGGKELIEIFRRVKELGVTTSLDMSIPDVKSDSGQVDWDATLRELLPFVDIYLPSVEETMFMIWREEFDKLNANADGHDMLSSLDINSLQLIGEKLLSYGAGIVVQKCGVKGYYIRTAGRDVLAGMGHAAVSDLENWADRELHEDSFHVPEVAAATGSGDSSIAGFLTSFLRGLSIEESIKIACAVGGQNVQVFDALSGIHSWDETLEMIPKWNKNRKEIPGDYWEYHENLQVWSGKQDSRLRRVESTV